MPEDFSLVSRSGCIVVTRARIKFAEEDALNHGVVVLQELSFRKIFLGIYSRFDQKGFGKNVAGNGFRMIFDSLNKSKASTR